MDDSSFGQDSQVVEMTSEMAARVARRYLRAQSGGSEPASGVLRGIEDAMRSLHSVMSSSVVPKDATPEEQRRIMASMRALKGLYDQAESLRLDVDEWIADYGRARRGP